MIDQAPHKLSRPFTAVLNDLQNRLKKHGGFDDIINLGLGNPGTPVDTELIETITKDLLEPENDADKGMARYGSSIGSPDARKAIAAFVNNENIRNTGYTFDEQFNQIAITPGITPSIQAYLTGLYNKGIVKPEDMETERQNDNIITHKKLRVLVPTPAYAWYYSIIDNVGGAEAIRLDTRKKGWKIDGELIEGALKQEPPPDVVILNYPCNPTGQDLDEGQWKDVADKFREHIKGHPDFRIVLDNSYKDLSFTPHKGLLEVAPDLMKHTIEFNSMAKFHGYAGRNGPGFAVSQSPDDIALLRSQLNTALGVGAGYENLLKEAFSEKYFSPEKIQEKLGLYRRRCDFVSNYINEQLQGDEQNSLVALKTGGGMFVYDDFSKYLDKKIDPEDARKMRQLLCEVMPENSDYFNHEVFDKNRINDDKDLSFYLILKAHVVTLPGQDFDRESDGMEGMVRMALGDIGDLTTYKNGRIENSFFEKYVPNAQDREGKPLDDLRKLKSAMDRSIEVLRGLDNSMRVA